MFLLNSIDFDVLVVGAGPVGLSLATELGMRGLGTLIVERNERVGHAPRAKTTNVRTRTHFRRWGLADKLAQASPLGIDYPYDVFFVTRLGAYQLARIQNGFNAAPVREEEFPEHAQWIPQYKLEAILRDHVATLPGVDLRFNVAFVAARQDGESVVSTLRSADGAEIQVRSRYLVGADGARSAVRDLIGAAMIGEYGISRNYNVVFRAPGLSAAHGQGRGVMYWQVNRDGASLIGPMDQDDIWFFMPTGMKQGQVLTSAEAAATIAQATGIDLPYEILSNDEWVASRLIADSYRKDRIFLVGDACHLHPPFGGYGMNMGIGDAVDLGWKLAAVLQGWGGPALLDSYEIERRPVHVQVMDEAVANHAVLGGQLWREGLEDATPEGDVVREAVGRRIIAAKTREFRTLATVLGGCYAGSPVIIDDGTAAKVQSGQDYQPDAHPGCLAPHAWLPDGRSLYDLFGAGFARVVAPGAETEAARARREADARGTPLEIVIPAGVAVGELYGAALTLVRPDQHVAWRGERWDDDVLRRVSGMPAAAAFAERDLPAVGRRLERGS